MNAIHGINTGKYRKAAKIAYPAAYAPSSRTDDAANQFNCAQRSHAQFGENHPSMLVALLLAGLRFPISSAILGASWSVGRYFYMTGYSQGGTGKGRYNGAIYYLGQYGLLLMTAYAGAGMVFGF
jgi:glutathione S-transferase